jgi:thiamine pyrophosphokinase
MSRIRFSGLAFASQQLAVFSTALHPVRARRGLMCVVCNCKLDKQTMTKCIILLGGDITATLRLMQQCRHALVIAADSGMRHADTLGVKVDCWLGDFDSTTPALARQYADLPRKVFPIEKDKTDGELAIEDGIARGATQFILVGAFGGPRTDHALLHNFQALALARRGFEVILTNGLEEAIPMLAGRKTFDLAAGIVFSLIGFGQLDGVSISGAKWPLTNRLVEAGSSLTLSNISTGPVHVSIKSGEALFIAGSLAPT